MKKALFLATISALSLILFGCGTEIKNPLADNSPIGDINNDSVAEAVSSTNTAITPATSSPVAPAPKKTIQRFYPEDLSPNPTSSDNSKSAPSKPKSTFSVTQELVIKLYLVDKYNPGICYGIPTPLTEQEISGLLSDNPDLVKFLKGKYDLKTDSAVYQKMKQIYGVQLTSDKGGYIYKFTDGQCCTLHAYQGEITVIGNNITDTVIRQQTQSNPC